MTPWRRLEKYTQWDTDVWWLTEKIEGPHGEAIYVGLDVDEHVIERVLAALNKGEGQDEAGARVAAAIEMIDEALTGGCSDMVDAFVYLAEVKHALKGAPKSEGADAGVTGPGTVPDPNGEDP